MYLSYFGLTEKPFNITPDPRFLYMSEQHREALAHLLFSTDESSSFIVLTGEVGAGKTTLCRSMLEEGVAGNHFALILNPMQSPLELLASACDEFGIHYPDHPGIKHLVDALNQWLLTINARNEQAILVIDEAQNLGFDTLEQIRLLTNLETGQKKLLKIILIGQPELRQILQQPNLRQLSQRVTARYHLQPMSATETGEYLQHRLRIAGINRTLFTPKAIKRLFRHSAGIPRKINLIADRALTGAYARQKQLVDHKLLSQAAREVAIGTTRGTAQSHRWRNVVIPMLGAAAALTWYLLAQPGNSDSKAATASTLRHEIIRQQLPTLEYVEALNAENSPIAAEEAVVTAHEQLSALASLFALWEIPLQPDSPLPACEQAEDAGIPCLYSTGSLESFISYNRPAVIELQDQSGEPQQWLIHSLRGNRFSIMDGSQPARGIDYTALAARWPGKFLTLWHTPPSGATSIVPGSPGEDFGWLWKQFQILDLLPAAAAAPGVFTAQLEQAVRDFQRTHGLSVDGIAGVRTLLKLEKSIYPATPLLLKPEQGNH